MFAPKNIGTCRTKEALLPGASLAVAATEAQRLEYVMEDVDCAQNVTRVGFITEPTCVAKNNVILADETRGVGLHAHKRVC